MAKSVPVVAEKTSSDMVLKSNILLFMNSSVKYPGIPIEFLMAFSSSFMFCIAFSRNKGRSSEKAFILLMMKMVMAVIIMAAMMILISIASILGNPFFSRKLAIGYSRYESKIPKVMGYKNSLAKIIP